MHGAGDRGLLRLVSCKPGVEPPHVLAGLCEKTGAPAAAAEYGRGSARRQARICPGERQQCTPCRGFRQDVSAACSGVTGRFVQRLPRAAGHGASGSPVRSAGSKEESVLPFTGSRLFSGCSVTAVRATGLGSRAETRWQGSARHSAVASREGWRQQAWPRLCTGVRQSVEQGAAQQTPGRPGKNTTKGKRNIP